jgi:hypothetical protein
VTKNRDRLKLLKFKETHFEPNLREVAKNCNASLTDFDSLLGVSIQILQHAFLRVAVLKKKH